MNKIIKLLIFFFFASNIFAMRLPNVNKPLSLVNNKRIVVQDFRQEFQEILQSVELNDFSKLSVIFTENEVIPELEQSQNSFISEKNYECLCRKENISSLICEPIELIDLLNAIKSNDILKIEEYLLKEDSMFDQRIFDEDCCNVLMFAIKYADVYTAMYLLQKHKFYFEEVDLYGRTALMYSVDNAQMFDVIVELLNQGANVNAKDKKNRNALIYAIHKPYNSKIVTTLLNKKADYEIIDEDKLSVLDHVVICQNIQIISILFLHGISKLQINNTLEMLKIENNKLSKRIEKLKNKDKSFLLKSNIKSNIEEINKLEGMQKKYEYISKMLFDYIKLF